MTDVSRNLRSEADRIWLFGQDDFGISRAPAWEAIFTIGEGEDPQVSKLLHGPDPRRRLKELQLGNQRRLYVHRILWMKPRYYAQVLIDDTVRELKKKGRHLGYGWFDFPLKYVLPTLRSNLTRVNTTHVCSHEELASLMRR